MKKKVYKIKDVEFQVDERYVIEKTIGYGAYGIVVSAKDQITGRKVAIKKIPKLFQDVVDGKRILREIKLLAHFKHDNVISIKDIMRPEDKESFNELYIVNDIMDIDLMHVIRSKQPLSEQHIQYFIYQVIRGLKYIHSANVMHRDLKPSNLLVNSNCDLKICDFGLARGVGQRDHLLTEYVVTRWYRSPELLLMSHDYDESIDMWSVGCILAELYNRKCLFPGQNYISQLKLIINVLGKPTSKDMETIQNPDAIKYVRGLPEKKPAIFEDLFPTASKEGIDFLKKLLVFNPKNRMNAKEALRHPFLASLHDETDEPECDVRFNFDMDDAELNQRELRDLFWKEILNFHPEDE
eukprot:gb/GECH01013033.1/.p1 GENE.gb/GECH01013033.1/~~gb/GECH01013033.1/.p1  ORF type:complete len:353 (+),score=47.07 gb/GECH01013033.1/:1-1059(+)